MWNVPMSLSLRHFGFFALLGVSTVLVDASAVFAGWMGFRNDTKDTIVIQETVVIGGQPRPGRPQRLFTGEAVRDTPPPGGQRRITVYDAATPNQPIYSGNFPCPAANENLLYCIKRDRKGGIAVDVIRTAVTVPIQK
jgi:hypothetical protein